MTVSLLARRFWEDDCGAVITSEYLLLGSVVTLGGVSGLAAMSNSVNQEMAEYGKAVGAVSQAYAVAAKENPVATRGGTKAIDTPATESADCCP
jgi:hypothetical protein